MKDTPFRKNKKDRTQQNMTVDEMRNNSLYAANGRKRTKQEDDEVHRPLDDGNSNSNLRRLNNDDDDDDVVLQRFIPPPKFPRLGDFRKNEGSPWHLEMLRYAIRISCHQVADEEQEVDQQEDKIPLYPRGLPNFAVGNTSTQDTSMDNRSGSRRPHNQESNDGFSFPKVVHSSSNVQEEDLYKDTLLEALHAAGSNASQSHLIPE